MSLAETAGTSTSHSSSPSNKTPQQFPSFLFYIIPFPNFSFSSMVYGSVIYGNAEEAFFFFGKQFRCVDKLNKIHQDFENIIQREFFS